MEELLTKLEEVVELAFREYCSPGYTKEEREQLGQMHLDLKELYNEWLTVN
jgi:hypothetical protein